MSNDTQVDIYSREGISPYSWVAKWETLVRQNPFTAGDAINESANDPNVFVTDRQIEHLCNHYAAAPEDERASIRRPDVAAMSLLHFATRSAVRAMRQGDASSIRLGLLALSIEDFRFDPRDSISPLIALRHASLKTGADWRGLVEEICTVSSEKVAGDLRGFLARPPDSITLEQFGMREGHDSNGPTIEDVRSQTRAMPKQRDVSWGQDPIVVFPEWEANTDDGKGGHSQLGEH